MKTHSCIYRSTLIGMMLTCLLFVGDYAAGQPQASGSAQLIIRRIPNLGNNVFVNIYLDGQPIGTIGYGQTYQGSVPTGQHLLSVQAAPRARTTAAPPTTLNVRSGETFRFTAMRDDYGRLVLRAN
jgi:hypothetical protein